MKTCDICKRDTAPGLNAADCEILSVVIGADSVRLPGELFDEPSKHPVRCDLCTECLKRVNRGIAGFLLERFGLQETP